MARPDFQPPRPCAHTHPVLFALPRLVLAVCLERFARMGAFPSVLLNMRFSGIFHGSIDYLLSPLFLFRNFDALNPQVAGERVNAHQVGPESERPNGISTKKDGTQKTL
jgi:hypothetical protein